MKLIEYRGGVVNFRIPSHWREEYSDYDGGQFYDDRPNSGTLRLTIILLRAPADLHRDSAMDILRGPINQLRAEGVEGTTRIREDGNAVFEYEEAASERGTAPAGFLLGNRKPAAAAQRSDRHLLLHHPRKPVKRAPNRA